MALYSIGYSILFTNGSAAPSWISYDDVDNKIVIDKDLATTTGSYAFMLPGEIFKSSVSTGKYRTINFTVVVYSLIASTALDQIYVIDGNSGNYSFSDFTCSSCSAAGYSITYSLEDTATGNNALTLYAAWLKLTGTILDYTTNDKTLYGEY